MAQNLRKVGLSDVTFKTMDGQLSNQSIASSENVSAILIDTSKMPDLFTSGYGLENATKLNIGDVVHIDQYRKAMDEYGIKPRVELAEGESETEVNFMYGIPDLLIKQFFDVRGGEFANGDLYVMFADCSKNWDAIEVLQNATGGTAYQIAIYTEQNLFGKELDPEGNYTLRLVKPIQDRAKQLEVQHQPAVILLHANTATLEGDTEGAGKVNLALMPNLLSAGNLVHVNIGQANSKKVNSIQLANPRHSTVGTVGSALGALTVVNVGSSIAWVEKINLYDNDFMRVELGFGDTNLSADGKFISTNALESVQVSVIDGIVKKGYNLPIKYAGKPLGVHFSSSGTCSNGDFDSLEHNRVIQKSRRGIREVLLPKLNSPVMVNRSDGTLPSATVTSFKNLVVDGVLAKMVDSGECSGYDVFIDAKQKVIVNGYLEIMYAIVPLGKLGKIIVTEKLATQTGTNK